MGSTDRTVWETRSGPFEPKLPGYSLQESRGRVHRFAAGERTVDDPVNRFLSEGVSDRTFRDVTGLLGYEIGYCMEEGSRPSDIEEMAQYACNCLQNSGDGGITVGPGAGPQDEVYGRPRVEVLLHIEDAILMGYWDR